MQAPSTMGPRGGAQGPGSRRRQESCGMKWQEGTEPPSSVQVPGTRAQPHERQRSWGSVHGARANMRSIKRRSPSGSHATKLRSAG